ncbi:MAG: DUF3006 domain-containing protein [Oscillospiraceae bacterium]|nr:DUF3006 domain-containing protein [Oscillospiraceae bacterium]
MGQLIIIDRIENGMAACEFENREIKMIPLEKLPDGIREGDCMYFEGGKYTIDADETNRRREETAAMLRKMTINN